MGLGWSVDLQQSKGKRSDEKITVLYMASGPQFEKVMKDSTPEQRKKGMDAWMKWMNANKASIAEGGAPLGKTKRVDSNEASNTRNEIGGYSVVRFIVSIDSRSAAAFKPKWPSLCPLMQFLNPFIRVRSYIAAERSWSDRHAQRSYPSLDSIPSRPAQAPSAWQGSRHTSQPPARGLTSLMPQTPPESEP